LTYLLICGKTGIITLGDPGAAGWGDGIFTGESLQQERESPWGFTLTERVPEAFEIPLADFSGQSEGENPVAPTSCPWDSEDGLASHFIELAENLMIG